MNKNKTIYWVTTSIVCAVMIFSAVNFNLNHPLGPMKGAFRHLGFPDYFKIELTVAKILGVLALLMPGVPRTIRHFAYAGFTITLISASIAHYSSGDSMMFIVDPLLFLTALAVSYVYSNKTVEKGLASRAAPLAAPNGPTAARRSGHSAEARATCP
jgi:hypothetical protein